MESKFPFSHDTSSLGVDDDEESHDLWAPISEGIISHDIVNGPSPCRLNILETGSSSETDLSHGPLTPPGPLNTDNTNSNQTTLNTDSGSPSSNNNEAQSEQETTQDIEVSTEPELGKGKRQKTTSTRLKGFVVPQPTQKSTSEVGNLAQISADLQPTTEVLYPLAVQDDTHRFSETHIAYVAAIVSTVEPRSFKKAMEDERWRNAVGSEFGALEENKTWSIEDLPPGKKAI
ncbi:hypothetical protein V5N11_026656 [Cardamine amara subsp. amara]|uniref:Uncharacterized protein n=1 Tax=Cardamine amara subsp. amara TaxID=228776 RepID=A0ABD1ALI7_CARAN